MGTMNISLPDPMKTWVEEQARTGRYANSSNYARDLIRHDRARTEAIAELQGAVDAGMASCAPTGLDRNEFSPPVRIHPSGAHLVIYHQEGKDARSSLLQPAAAPSGSSVTEAENHLENARNLFRQTEPPLIPLVQSAKIEQSR